MTKKDVLLRFALIYGVALIGFTYLASHFFLKFGGVMKSAVLVVSVMWVSNSFGKANNRNFTDAERMTIVIGMILIDLGLQLFLDGVAILQSNADVDLGDLMFARLLLVAMHAVGIYFFVGVAKKPLEKSGNIHG